MSERSDEQNEGSGGTASARGRDAVIDTSESSESARVREVVGRRGYDEAEDEAAAEEEQH